jgi:hypothetical protein
MAHVAGEKMAATAAKMAEEASCPMMMESAAGDMMGGMMGSGMGGMMGSGMGGMMGSGMGGMTGSGMSAGTMMNSRTMTAGMATGAAMTASAKGRSFVAKIVTHPLVLFAAGLALGYLVHKYREGIIQEASQPVE